MQNISENGDWWLLVANIYINRLQCQSTELGSQDETSPEKCLDITNVLIGRSAQLGDGNVDRCCDMNVQRGLYRKRFNRKAPLPIVLMYRTKTGVVLQVVVQLHQSTGSLINKLFGYLCEHGLQV
ncbi:hypothetical protein D3C87_1427440 [compost metagenome]